MDKVSITRNQLFELVWSKPMTALSEEFGLSDNGLRKICRKFNIPLPYAGYWAKIKFGKPVRKMKLPGGYEGKNEITIYASYSNKEENKKKYSERTELIKEIETKYKKFLEVPLRLTNPDPIVVSTKDDLAAKKTYVSENGQLKAYSKFLKITVTQENVPRALRFMDALIKLLKARGHDIKVSSEESYAVVFGEEIVIRLGEKYRVEDVVDTKFNWKTKHYYPTGILVFKCWKDFYWQQKVWKDDKQLLEAQLAKIAAGIELFARKEIKERLEREERRRLEKEKQRIEQERHDREELDGANFLKLIEQANKWKQAQILKEFINEIENKALLSNNLTEELNTWLKWAKDKVEKYDPLIEMSLNRL